MIWCRPTVRDFDSAGSAVATRKTTSESDRQFWHVAMGQRSTSACHGSNPEVRRPPILGTKQSLQFDPMSLQLRVRQEDRVRDLRRRPFEPARGFALAVDNESPRQLVNVSKRRLETPKQSQSEDRFV